MIDWKKEEPILPSEEPIKEEDTPASANEPATKQKEEDNINIPNEDKIEENNPLLYFFDWLFNLIRLFFYLVLDKRFIL